MWSLGFLLILGTVFRSQESNGVLLPEERGEDPCYDRLSKILLGALHNRHFITDVKPKLIMEIVFPNFADLFTGNSGNDILSQGKRVEFSIPDLDPEDPIHQINFPDWDRGTLENGIIIPKYGNIRNGKIPSHGRTVNQIIYHYPGVSSFKLPHSDPDISRKDEAFRGDEKLDYTDIFEKLEAQEAEERKKEEEAKEMEETKKLEETKKPEEAKKAEASTQISESGSPQNRINYSIHHHKNPNKNGNIKPNLNSRRHKWVRNQ